MEPIEQVAREVVRALRGTRSQVAFSRRLGYRTNVAYTWEAGRRWPLASEVLAAARLNGRDVREGISVFLAARPAWLAEVEPTGEEAVRLLIGEVCASVSRVELARRTGFSRHALARWLSGAARPRVHELFAVVAATTSRLSDLVAIVVDPGEVPSLRPEWEALQARRTLATRMPWAPAVLRTLEIEEYRALPVHRPGWIAQRLGVAPAVEADCLAALEASRAVSWDGSRYRVDRPLSVDTRRAPDAGRLLQAHWSEVGLERVRAGAPGLFAYNVFSVSRRDLEQLEQLHRSHWQRMRAIVAASEPAEAVAVLNLQLFELR